MRPNPNEKELMVLIPLMKCFHRLEFSQRLLWLSEGMLKNHLEHTSPYKISEQEKENYVHFKNGELWKIKN